MAFDEASSRAIPTATQESRFRTARSVPTQFERTFSSEAVRRPIRTDGQPSRLQDTSRHSPLDPDRTFFAAAGKAAVRPARDDRSHRSIAAANADLSPLGSDDRSGFCDLFHGTRPEKTRHDRRVLRKPKLPVLLHGGLGRAATARSALRRTDRPTVASPKRLGSRRLTNLSPTYLERPREGIDRTEIGTWDKATRP